jgi:AraC-like DNA-binding protein
MQPVLDAFTLVIFLGVIQGVFLAVFFIGHGSENPVANRMLGFLLLSLSAVIFEILLQYSGYITRVVHLVNFSEPLNFAIGPLAYLAVYAGVRHIDRLPRRQYLHFIPLVLYTIYCIAFFIQPAEYKFNAFIDAYHPDQPYISAGERWHPDPFGWRRFVNELTMLHLFIYSGMGVQTVRAGLKQRGLGFLSRADAELTALRTFALQFIVVAVALLVVKATFKNDLGDYILATLVTLIIYTVSIVVIRGSSFFEVREEPENRPKYERSSLTEDKTRSLLERLSRLVETERPHLENGVSLPDLASRLAVSPHHLSQALNAELGQSFFEFIARHRIQEAQRILAGPDGAALKIEEVAERVGYYSKSAFNTAFKRIAGATPSEFRNRNAK